MTAAPQIKTKTVDDPAAGEGAGPTGSPTGDRGGTTAVSAGRPGDLRAQPPGSADATPPNTPTNGQTGHRGGIAWIPEGQRDEVRRPGPTDGANDLPPPYATDDRGERSWMNLGKPDASGVGSSWLPETEDEHFERLYLSPIYFEEVAQRTGAAELAAQSDNSQEAMAAGLNHSMTSRLAGRHLPEEEYHLMREGAVKFFYGKKHLTEVELLGARREYLERALNLSHDVTITMLTQMANGEPVSIDDLVMKTLAGYAVPPAQARALAQVATGTAKAVQEKSMPDPERKNSLKAARADGQVTIAESQDLPLSREEVKAVLQRYHASIKTAEEVSKGIPQGFLQDITPVSQINDLRREYPGKTDAQRFDSRAADINAARARYELVTNEGSRRDAQNIRLALAMHSLTIELATIPFSGIRAPAELWEGVAPRAIRTPLNPLGPMKGPVVKRPLPNATLDQMAEVHAYVQGSNEAWRVGALSKVGRVSTAGPLRSASNKATAAQRATGSYTGVVGHVPDTTWTGQPEAYIWLDQTSRVNSSIGAQAAAYPIGFRPTGFTVPNEMKFADYSVDLAGIDVDELILEWKWAVPAGLKVMAMTKFGDCFLRSEDDRIIFLDTLDGSLLDCGKGDLFSDDFVETHRLSFFADWVDICVEQGLLLGEGECYGWRVHPMIGGEFTFENIWVYTIRVYPSVTGQLVRQLSRKPPE